MEIRWCSQRWTFTMERAAMGDSADESSSITILDTRSPDEYHGVDVRADRGDRIPQAVNVEWTQGVAEGGRFRPLADLAQIYAFALEEEGGGVITLCQTGVRGAHTCVVLRVLGHEEARVYDGSWPAWDNNPVLPVES